MNHCELCAQDKDEAMLLVQCGGHKRQVCGSCAWTMAQSLVTCRTLARSYENRNAPVPTALQQILNRPGRYADPRERHARASRGAGHVPPIHPTTA